MLLEETIDPPHSQVDAWVITVVVEQQFPRFLNRMNLWEGDCHI
jgi:hypothetical protein